jgi:hypothetical protein
MKKLIKSIDKIKLIRVCFKIRKDKKAFEKLYTTSKYVREVLKNDK